MYRCSNIKPVETTGERSVFIGFSEMYAVILLKMVMVSPGTHLVKNDEFQCKANESQFKNQPVLN